MKKIVALLLVLLLMARFAPFSFASGPSISSEQIATEYESNLQYTSMLNSFANADGTQAYPDYYGGAYLNSEGLLVVNVTERTPAIEQEIKTATGNDDIIFSVVDYSYNYLLDLNNQLAEFIDSGLDEELASMITASAVLDRSNDMEISLKELNSTLINSVITKVFGLNTARSMELSLPLSFVVGDSVDVSQETANASRTIAAQGAPAYSLYLGDNVVSESYFGLSVGFPCYYYSDGTYYSGFVTAAHGCDDDDDFYDINGRTIGTVFARQYSGTVDAAFVAITDSSFSMPTVIDAVVSSGTTYYHSYYTVTPGGSVFPAVGTTLFKDGKTTDLTFATVDSVSASNWPSTDGVTIRDLLRVDEEIAEGGDSGGIAFTLGSGNYASIAGITQSVGGGKTYFVKHFNIVDALDLVLVP